MVMIINIAVVIIVIMMIVIRINIISVFFLQEFKKNSGSGLQNFTVFDSYDDSFVDYHDKYLDDFSNLQTYFDNVDIPTGVEAPVPWFQDPVPCSNKKDSGSTSSSKSSSTFLNPVGASPPFVSVMAPFVGGSSMLNPMNGLGQIAAGLDVPSSFVPPMPAQSKNSSPLHHLGSAKNLPFDAASSAELTILEQ